MDRSDLSWACERKTDVTMWSAMAVSMFDVDGNSRSPILSQIPIFDFD